MNAVGWCLWAALSVAQADEEPARDGRRTTQPLAHFVEVSGLPEDSVLVVAHATPFIRHLTVLPEDGRHSLQSWDEVPSFGVRSPRVFLVTKEALDAWKVRARAAIDAAEEEPDAEGLVELPSPAPRLDCGIALRIQRYGPSHWPYEYVDTLQVVEASSSSCVVELEPPELPSRLSAMSPVELGLAGGSLVGGLVLMGASARRRKGTPGGKPARASPAKKTASSRPAAKESKASASRKTRTPPQRPPRRPPRPVDNDVEPPRESPRDVDADRPTDPG